MPSSKLSCAILQPHYLPWLGYFEMLNRVDLFVFLDDVKFVKREWKNRNKIRKTSFSDEYKWLTVPVEKNSRDNLLSETKIYDKSNWRNKHLNGISSVYAKSPNFEKFYPILKSKINELDGETCLSEINILLIGWIIDLLGFKTCTIKSSELASKGKNKEKLLNICHEINATSFLANNATETYVSGDYFRDSGIEFSTQDYKHPQYLQIYNNKELPFLSNLSIVDLLFNKSFDDSYKIICSGGVNS